METSVCASCQKNPTALKCGICESAACKRCAHILGEDTFSFLAEIPAHLRHDIYCNPCFLSQVAADLESYNETMERARDITVYYKAEGKETRRVKRVEKPVFIKNCLDRNELILRLAFAAAHIGCNAMIDIDLVCEKVHDQAYQTAIWHGSGIPANISRCGLNFK